MSPFKHPQFVLFDLEFTSWEGAADRVWSRAQEFREVIALGAIKVDESQQVLGSYSSVVKPSKNPVISEYIQKLTGLSNSQLHKEGIPFEQCFDEFADFVGDSVAYSYGADGIVLIENLALQNIPYKSHLYGEEESFDVCLDAHHEAPKEGNKIGIYGAAANQAKHYARMGLEVYFGPAMQRTLKVLDISPWIHKNLSASKGKSSGELGPMFDDFKKEGHSHDPLFDVHSVLHALKKIEARR